MQPMHFQRFLHTFLMSCNYTALAYVYLVPTMHLEPSMKNVARNKKACYVMLFSSKALLSM